MMVGELYRLWAEAMAEEGVYVEPDLKEAIESGEMEPVEADAWEAVAAKVEHA